jgi:hypothetical protein
MSFQFLKMILNDLINSLKGENDLYDHTDGQFMYFEKHRSRSRPLSNKEIHIRKKNRISPN